MTWKTSDTAPKDGREIMFCRTPPYGAGGNITIGFWHVGQNVPGFQAVGSGGRIVLEIWYLWDELPELPETTNA